MEPADLGTTKRVLPARYVMVKRAGQNCNLCEGDGFSQHWKNGKEIPVKDKAFLYHFRAFRNSSWNKVVQC